MERAESLLKEAGFAVSQPCSSRPSCFDYAAQKDEKLVFLRFQKNIDSLCLSDSMELKHITDCVMGMPLLISETSREKPLEDDTAYSRYGMWVITPKTFENIVARQTYPLIQAGPGGYYVEIDSAAIRKGRQELGLSVGEMAEKIGVSRRTLYGYERGMAKGSITVAYKLIQTLGIPAARPVDIFIKPKRQRSCPFKEAAERLIVRNKILQWLFKKFNRYKFAAISRAPFDFIIIVPEDKMTIIGAVGGTREPDLDKRIKEILSVGKVMQAHAILITEKKVLTHSEISCIASGELLRIHKPGDLVSNFT